MPQNAGQKGMISGMGRGRTGVETGERVGATMGFGGTGG